MFKTIVLSVAALLAFPVAVAYAGTPPKHHVHRTDCIRQVSYNGGPYQGVETVVIDANTCNNEIEAAVQCVTSTDGYVWATGGEVQAPGDESYATCTGLSGFVGTRDYGFRWLNGGHWVYTGH